MKNNMTAIELIIQLQNELDADIQKHGLVGMERVDTMKAKNELIQRMLTILTEDTAKQEKELDDNEVVYGHGVGEITKKTPDPKPSEDDEIPF